MKLLSAPFIKLSNAVNSSNAAISCIVSRVLKLSLVLTYAMLRRGFFSSAPASADDMAKEAQKTAGNPYAPTSSAGGTPTDNKADEGMGSLSEAAQHAGLQKMPAFESHRCF